MDKIFLFHRINKKKLYLSDKLNHTVQKIQKRRFLASILQITMDFWNNSQFTYNPNHFYLNLINFINQKNLKSFSLMTKVTYMFYSLHIFLLKNIFIKKAGHFEDPGAY